MKQSKISKGHNEYLKSLRKEKITIFTSQIALLVGFIVLWEALARLNIIDVFLSNN